MKKTILKRSVASTLSFLMAFSSAVPSSVVYLFMRMINAIVITFLVILIGVRPY